MEYVVIREFTDKDTKQKYLVGDRYPHKGFASKERAEELSTDKNKREVPLIAPKAEKAEKPAESSETVVKRGKKK